MNDFTKTWNNLKNRFYSEKNSNSPDSWYEDLRKEFSSLNIKVPEVKTILADKTFAYVCPDIEFELPMVFILPEVGITDKNYYMNLIYNSIYEYYKFSDFYDGITNLRMNDLLALCIAEYNIPIVQWFKVDDTEILNVRRLRFDVY